MLAALKKDRKWVQVASDSANAFFSISKHVFTAMKERKPAWVPLTQWAYKQPKRTCCEDTPLHVAPVLARTRTRTRQGPFMGPINCALPMHSRLELVSERHPHAVAEISW